MSMSVKVHVDTRSGLGNFRVILSSLASWCACCVPGHLTAVNKDSAAVGSTGPAVREAMPPTQHGARALAGLNLGGKAKRQKRSSPSASKHLSVSSIIIIIVVGDHLVGRCYHDEHLGLFFLNSPTVCRRYIADGRISHLDLL
jgi:hypothetical protein